MNKLDKEKSEAYVSGRCQTCGAYIGTMREGENHEHTVFMIMSYRYKGEWEWNKKVIGLL